MLKRTPRFQNILKTQLQYKTNLPIYRTLRVWKKKLRMTILKLLRKFLCPRMKNCPSPRWQMLSPRLLLLKQSRLKLRKWPSRSYRSNKNDQIPCLKVSQFWHVLHQPSRCKRRMLTWWKQRFLARCSSRESSTSWRMLRAMSWILKKPLSDHKVTVNSCST